MTIRLKRYSKTMSEIEQVKERQALIDECSIDNWKNHDPIEFELVETAAFLVPDKEQYASIPNTYLFSERDMYAINPSRYYHYLFVPLNNKEVERTKNEYVFRGLKCFVDNATTIMYSKIRKQFILALVINEIHISKTSFIASKLIDIGKPVMWEETDRACNKDITMLGTVTNHTYDIRMQRAYTGDYLLKDRRQFNRYKKEDIDFMIANPDLLYVLSCAQLLYEIQNKIVIPDWHAQELVPI